MSGVPDERRRRREEERRVNLNELAAAFDIKPPNEVKLASALKAAGGGLETPAAPVAPVDPLPRVAPANGEDRSAPWDNGFSPAPEMPALVSSPEPALALPGPPPLQEAPKVEPDLPPAQRRSARLNATSDPKLEAIYDAVARGVLRRRGRARAPGRRRLNAPVTQDVYSRVVRLAHARRLDASEILTWLLDAHLPSGHQPVPAWLREPPRREVDGDPEAQERYCVLGYVCDDDLRDRLDALRLDYGRLRVEIVEAVVTRVLPPVAKPVVPAQRPRRVY